MIIGLLGNKSSYSNRLILVNPKSENDVRLQAKLDSKNPMGLPVGVVSEISSSGRRLSIKMSVELKASFVF